MITRTARLSVWLIVLLGLGGGACFGAETRADVIRNQPKHQPTVLQKFNPVFWFGNLDDPEPPEWYRRDDPARTGKWYRRNVLHNFTFYVIGIADREFEHTGRFPGQIFHPKRGWNWTVCRAGWLRLPLISYKGRRVVFYIGWRERGNFGLKLNFRTKTKAKPAAASARVPRWPGG